MAEEQAELERQIDHEIEMAIVGSDPLAPENVSGAPRTEEPSGELTGHKVASPSDEPDRGARRRRLAWAGYEADRCAMLGRPLDAGPRAAEYDHPVLLVPGFEEITRPGGEVISRLAQVLLAARVTPEELEHAAAWLRSRAGQ